MLHFILQLAEHRQEGKEEGKRSRTRRTMQATLQYQTVGTAKKMIDRIAEEEKDKYVVLLSPAVGQVCTENKKSSLLLPEKGGGAPSFFFSFTASALFCGAVTSPLRRKRANQVDHANIP